MENFKDAIYLLGMVCVVGLLTLSLVRADESAESLDYKTQCNKLLFDIKGHEYRALEIIQEKYELDDIDSAMLAGMSFGYAYGRCLFVSYQHQKNPDSVSSEMLERFTGEEGFKKSINNIAGVEVLK